MNTPLYRNIGSRTFVRRRTQHIANAAPPPPLQLYVWTGYFPDYTDGLAFAIAHTEAEARELVIAKADGLEPSTWGTLSVHPLNSPIAFEVAVGG